MIEILNNSTNNSSINTSINTNVITNTQPTNNNSHVASIINQLEKTNIQNSWWYPSKNGKNEYFGLELIFIKVMVIVVLCII